MVDVNDAKESGVQRWAVLELLSLSVVPSDECRYRAKSG